MLVLAYQTSDLYLEAIQSQARTTKVTGTLKLVNGTVIEITNDMIASGSLYITNQCVNGDAFEYGSVFAAEAGLTLKTEIDRYSIYGAELSLTFSILLSDGTYEGVPLGIFYVNEPTRVGKDISMKAYDGMVSLEVDTEESLTGTPYELLNVLSIRCGISLAQTQDEINSLVNGTRLLSVNQATVTTYRDMLSYICQVTCTFGAFDREGKLRLYEMGGESVRTISPKVRASSKFSDFETYFTSISASFLVAGSYNKYLLSAESDTGLLYDFGEVPIVQGLDEVNQEMLQSIFDKLQTIKYIPSEITFNGDPAIDLGDILTCIDRDGSSFNMLVTFYKWTYRGSEIIKSAGLNPKLKSIKEKKDAALAEIRSELKTKTIAVYSYANSKKLTIKGGTEIKDYTEVIRIAFAVEYDVTALFMATVHLSMDTDGYVELIPYLDSVQCEGDNIIVYCNEGDNVITFMNYIPCSKGVTYKYQIMARTYGEATPLKVAEAERLTLVNQFNAISDAYKTLVETLKSSTEETAISYDDLVSEPEYEVVEAEVITPKATIEQFHAKGAIFGQGLAGKVAWDGTITFSELLTPFTVNRKVDIATLSEVLSFNNDGPSKSNITETIKSFTVNRTMPMFKSVSADISFGKVIDNYTFGEHDLLEYEYNSSCVIKSDEGFTLISSKEIAGNDVQIDDGVLKSFNINTENMSNLQEVQLTW